MKIWESARNVPPQKKKENQQLRGILIKGWEYLRSFLGLLIILVSTGAQHLPLQAQWGCMGRRMLSKLQDVQRFKLGAGWDANYWGGIAIAAKRKPYIPYPFCRLGWQHVSSSWIYTKRGWLPWIMMVSQQIQRQVVGGLTYETVFHDLNCVDLSLISNPSVTGSNTGWSLQTLKINIVRIHKDTLYWGHMVLRCIKSVLYTLCVSQISRHWNWGPALHLLWWCRWAVESKGSRSRWKWVRDLIKFYHIFTICLPYFAIEMLVNVGYIKIYQVISHIGMLPRFSVGIYKSKLKLWCFLPGHLWIRPIIDPHAAGSETSLARRRDTA